MKSHWWRNG